MGEGRGVCGGGGHYEGIGSGWACGEQEVKDENKPQSLQSRLGVLRRLPISRRYHTSDEREHSEKPTNLVQTK